MAVRQITIPTGFPVPLIMKGMGSEPRLVSAGAGSELVLVIQRVFKRGGDLWNKPDNTDIFSVSVMLLSVNGDELIHPKEVKNRFTVNNDDNVMVEAIKVSTRKVLNPRYSILIEEMKVFKGSNRDERSD